MASDKQQQLEATLPAAHYLDSAHFARESNAIFSDEWFCVGRDQGLSARGEYRLVNIVGESVLLVCDDAGEVRGFHNVCRHRGAELVASPSAAEVCGHFTGGIRCPYHSWNYRLDGSLHSTPHIDIDKECLGLHRVDVARWGGFVFVRTGSGSETLEAMLGDIPARIKRYPLHDLQSAHRIDYSVAANWKVILENYNECYHCAGVHPELCKIVPDFRKGGTGLDWDRGIEQKPGTNTFTFSGRTNRAPFPGLDADEQVRHKGELIYPNLLLSLSMDHAAAFTIWPRSAERTDISCEFLFHPDEMAKEGFDPSDAIEFWDVVNKQDWHICESVQRGMRSRVFESGYYGPMEDLSLDIRDYVSRKLDRS